MDPISLATLTSALVALAKEAGKGAASEAGKSLWASAKKALGLGDKEPDETLAVKVAEKLHADPRVAAKLTEQLKALPPSEPAGRMIQRLQVKGENVVVADVINVSGDFVMGGGAKKG